MTQKQLGGAEGLDRVPHLGAGVGCSIPLGLRLPQFSPGVQKAGSVERARKFQVLLLGSGIPELGMLNVQSAEFLYGRLQAVPPGCWAVTLLSWLVPSRGGGAGGGGGRGDGRRSRNPHTVHLTTFR